LLDKESGINPILIAFVLISTAALIVLYLWTKSTPQLIFTQTSIPCDGKSTLPIKVQFVNAFGKLIKQRKDRVVEMEATSGRIQNIVIPAGRESVEATLTSSKEYGPVTITAKSGKQKFTAQADFVCDEAGLDVEISPASIPADGKSTATVSIKIKDDKGDYVTSLQERTVDLSITVGTITSPVKIPPRTPAGTAVIKAGKMSGTAKVMAACSPFNKKGKMITGEGRIIFTEPAKRYCMHCGASMTMDEQSCPSCGKTPPSGIDTMLYSACNAVLPLSAKFCSTCGVGQKM
jgi:ribosomal protein L40E